MAGNLRNQGLSRGLDMSNFYVRASLTPKVRIKYDLMNENVANGIGGVSISNDRKSSYVPRESEILGKNRKMTGYNRAKSQEDTASMADSAAQDMTPTQGMQNVNRMDGAANGKEYSMIRDENDAVNLGQGEDYGNRMNSFNLKQGAWNGRDREGDNDYSFAPWRTVIHGAQMKMAGDSRNLNGGYRGQDFPQFGLGQTLGLGALQGMADNGTQPIGQELENWMGRTSLADGLLFSEQSMDGLQAGYSVIYDAVQKYGGWDAAKNALPADVERVFSGIGTFLYDWGEEMAEFLLTKAPFPPYVKIAIAVGFFMKAVYDIVEEVRKKRETRIKDIKAQNPDWEQWKPWELEEKANESLDAWVIQAVGEKAIGAMLGTTAKEFGLNGIAQTALSTAWNRFVAEAKAGRWERKTR